MNQENEWRYPFIVDTTYKSSFVLIAESEEIRELWVEAFVSIFKSDSKAPKLSAHDESTKERSGLADLPLSADKLLDPLPKRSKIQLRLPEAQHDEAYSSYKDSLIMSPPT